MYNRDHRFPIYVCNINVTNLKKIDEKLVYKYLIDEGHISEIYQHQKRIEEWHRRYPQKFGKDNVAYRFQFIRRYSTGKVVIDSILTTDFDYIVEHICERTLVNTNLKTIEFPATYELLEMDKAEAKAKLNRVYLEQNKIIEKETENRLSRFNSIYGNLLSITKDDVENTKTKCQSLIYVGIVLCCILPFVLAFAGLSRTGIWLVMFIAIIVLIIVLKKNNELYRSNLAMVDYIAKQKSKYSHNSTVTSRLTEVFALLNIINDCRLDVELDQLEKDVSRMVNRGLISDRWCFSDEDIDIIEKELKKKYEKQVTESELKQLKIENLKLQNEGIAIDNVQKKFWRCVSCGNLNRADDMRCPSCGGIRPLEE